MSSIKKKRTSRKLKIIIPVAAAAVILVVFTVLFFFTDVFSSKPDNALSNGNQTAAPGQGGENGLQATPTPPEVSTEPSSVFSGEGGEVRVYGNSMFEFTPGTSGYWIFRTSDNGDYDPDICLLDSNGDVIVYDDNSGGNQNAFISYYLDEGLTYIIDTRVYALEGTGSFTLIVELEPELVIDAPPIGEGSVSVTGESWFTFTPEQSGVWEFKTSQRGDSDPYLELLDDNENNVAYDDNSGDGLNALISVRLIGGTSYTIKVNFYTEDEQSCTLTISPGG